MIKRLRKLPHYFFAFAVMLLTTIIFEYSFSKADGFLIINQLHPKWLDVSFSYITHLGDGLVSLLVAVILLILRKKKKAITLILAFIYSGILVQIVKRSFPMPRPRYFFEQEHFQYTHFVDGVSTYGSNSFPSGHTASAFAMATVLVLVFKKKRISLACILAAAIIGYSRIYLAQHFPIDVTVGALAGVSCALMSYYQVYDLKLFRSVSVAKRLKQFRMVNSETRPV